MLPDHNKDGSQKQAADNKDSTSIQLQTILQGQPSTLACEIPIPDPPSPPRSLISHRSMNLVKVVYSVVQEPAPSSSKISDLPVVGLDEVGEVLGLLVAVVVVTVVVVVAVVLGSEVLHLVDVTALGASLDGALAGDL